MRHAPLRFVAPALLFGLAACTGANGATTGATASGSSTAGSSGTIGSTTGTAGSTGCPGTSVPGAPFAIFTPEIFPQPSVMGIEVPSAPRVGIWAFPSGLFCADGGLESNGPMLDVEVDTTIAPGTYAVGPNGFGDVHGRSLPASGGLPVHDLRTVSGSITLTRAGPDEVAGCFDVQVMAVYFVTCDGGCGLDQGYDVYVDAGRLTGTFDEPVCTTF